MIKLLRIDDRLLHGQVSFSWIAYFKLKRIVIFNDEAALDGFTKMVLKLSIPKDIVLDIFMVQEAAREVPALAASKDSSIIIVGNLPDAKTIDEVLRQNAGYSVDFNIGGLRNRPHSVQINEYVYFTNEDLSVLKQLLSRGGTITVRRVPQDAPITISTKMIDGLYGDL
jgi:mannose/fructose/N-acetylgalactosamine-specific phosphotransferase system component IIB